MTEVLPDATGHFGPYGGVFVADTLIQAWASQKSFTPKVPCRVMC